MRLTLRLMAVLGKRAFVSFAVVTFLIGALLSAVEITSRHALKLFVEDQLRRIPWDLAVYQPGGAPPEDELPGVISSVGGIQRVERLAFLRASFPGEGEVGAAVDGKPLATPWICMIAATDPSLLPPKLQFALGSANHSGPPSGSPRTRSRYPPGMESCLKKLVLEAAATGFQDREKGGREPVGRSGRKPCARRARLEANRCIISNPPAGGQKTNSG